MFMSKPLKFAVAPLFLLWLTIGASLHADSVSIGTRSATDYQSNSYGFRHTFNEDHSGSLSYSCDGLRDDFNSLQLSVNRYFSNSSLSLLLGNDYSKDLSKTNSVGLRYSITFKSEGAAAARAVPEEVVASGAIAGALSGDLTVEEAGTEPAVDEQFFIPRVSLGANFSKTSFVSQNVEDNATNYTVGAGLAVGQLFDLAVNWNGYSYRNESQIKDAAPRRLAQNPLLQQLSSSPRSSVDGTFTYTINEWLQAYYSANSTVDLLGDRAGSRTVGLALFLLDSISIDFNNEVTTDDLSYTSVTCGYYF